MCASAEPSAACRLCTPPPLNLATSCVAPKGPSILSPTRKPLIPSFLSVPSGPPPCHMHPALWGPFPKLRLPKTSPSFLCAVDVFNAPALALLYPAESLHPLRPVLQHPSVPVPTTPPEPPSLPHLCKALGSPSPLLSLGTFLALPHPHPRNASPSPRPARPRAVPELGSSLHPSPRTR